LDQEFVCDINHPLFNVIDNPTRRQILRLIACEHNYGNRIASILNLSTPAIHRHLKFLLGESNDAVPIIQKGLKTKQSFSGRKGGEATLYEINSKMGLFFGIFSNFIHSQVYQITDGNKISIAETRSSTHDAELLGLSPPTPSNSPETRIEELQSDFYTAFEKIQEYNQQIIVLQKELMMVLNEKNDYMNEVDKLVKEAEVLNYEERVLLRAITCLGPECSSDLSHLLNLDNAIIKTYVNKLRNENWLK
jgi:predicted transcriptional regulator